MNTVFEMKNLINQIKAADNAYFVNDKPVMTDREYDILVKKLKDLEETTGIIFANSPTCNVSGSIKQGLDTVRHTKPMLSAKKTKNFSEVAGFAKNQDVMISWKLDGLTLVLRYKNGNFVQAITRGSDGIIGEDVTHTVQYLRGVPKKVTCKENFEVRGEGVLSWADLAILDKNNTDSTHPRNIASGAVRAITPDRGKCSHIDFIAFEEISDKSFTTKSEMLNNLVENGFNVVPHVLVTSVSGDEGLKQMVNTFDPQSYTHPVDGLVIEYEDIAYGKSLGATGHHENRMIALKWKDELYNTVFTGVECATTRTGVVSLMATFEPVDIDGSTVRRANLFNVGYFENLKLGIGDIITVYKANMIIPQIAENLTKSNSFKLPDACPACGEKLQIRVSKSGVKELYCPNESCIARNAQKIARFCDKNAMNITGLSAVTLEKFIENGWVKNYADLYHLERYREDIENTAGFGPVMYRNIQESVADSRICNLAKFLNAMSIPLMGLQTSKLINLYYNGCWEDFERAIKSNFDFSHIDGISSALSNNIHKWYNNPNEEKLYRPVLTEITLTKGAGITGKHDSNAKTGFAGSNIVVTGTITNMTRKQITEVLTLMGANVSDSVSSNTDYLIVGANPGGNKLGAAMKHGTTILPESEFIKALSSS